MPPSVTQRNVIEWYSKRIDYNGESGIYLLINNSILERDGRQLRNNAVLFWFACSVRLLVGWRKGEKERRHSLSLGWEINKQQN